MLIMNKIVQRLQCMVGSSDANLFASISAGISALWGPLHGGANQACVEMLEMIVADGGNVKIR